jgi:hypothetical protein
MAPALYIRAGDQWWTVSDPQVRTVAVTSFQSDPQEVLERRWVFEGKAAALVFKHPHPISARITLNESGAWAVYPEVGTRLGLWDGRGVHHVLSLWREDAGESAAWIVAGERRVVYGTQAVLTEGYNRLFMSSSEDVLRHEGIELFVSPPGTAGLLSDGKILRFASAYEASEARGVLPTAPSEPASPEEIRLRNEIARVTREHSDLSAALQSAPPGETWILLSKAVQMAKRRRDLLEGEKAALMGHVGNFHAAVEAALDKLRNRPPLLTDDQYSWALAYARSRE